MLGQPPDTRPSPGLAGEVLVRFDHVLTAKVLAYRHASAPLRAAVSNAEKED